MWVIPTSGMHRLKNSSFLRLQNADMLTACEAGKRRLFARFPAQANQTFHPSEVGELVQNYLEGITH